jgi:hypothetical protein
MSKTLPGREQGGFEGGNKFADMFYFFCEGNMIGHRSILSWVRLPLVRGDCNTGKSKKKKTV